MRTYFDKREKREKPVPDCSRVGCVWDEETQRCERGFAPMNLLYDPTEDEWGEPDGMGFLPGPAMAGAAGAGPVGWIVAGVAQAASLLWKLFGGKDDQKTSFRPPANAREYGVRFDDKYGKETVSYDMGAQTQQITASRGNRWDDISSYYSAFLSGNTSSGASSAAKRVIEDAARINGVSIARAADLILQVAGAVRIVQPFLPGPGMDQGNGQQPTGLPGYCPLGTYHPFPIGHPQQDLCAPFPGWEDIGQTPAQKAAKAAAAAAAAAKAQSNQLANLPKCPAGQYYSTARKACVPIPQCPQGQAFNPKTERCGAPGEGEGLLDLFKKMPFPMWIILALVIALMLSGNKGSGTTTTITKRKAK